MDPKWRFLHVLWEHRTKFLVLMLIMSLVAPQPARAQFGIDWGAIVAAINSIGSAITNTIAPALRAINGALGTLNNLVSSIQAFFTNIVFPVRIPKVQLAFGGQRQTSTAMIDSCDEVLSGAKAERAMADGFDLVVHALHSAIGDAVLGPR
jgi:hypothetical protein